MKENIYRTHYYKDLDSSKIGKEVTVSGWIENIRDHRRSIIFRFKR